MRQLALFAIVIVPVFSTGAAGAFAQSPADEFSRRQAQEERLQRLDALGAQTPGAVSPTTPASAARPGSGGPCFVVERIAVEGVRIIPGEEIETVTEPYADRCVGIAQIDDLLRKITHLYLDRGFIASRAYVPEQDIAAARALRLVVVEGSLSEIYLNGKPAPGSRLLKTAFPGVAGRPAKSALESSGREL